MTRTTWLSVTSISLALSFMGVNANADIILANDNFTGSSGTGVATVNNTESTGIGTYNTIQGANGMSVTTVSGFGDGNVLSLANGTQTYYRQFDSATTLTLNSLDENQTLRLAFDVRFDGSFGGADNFSFGFVNSNAPNSIVYANVDLSATGGTPSDFRYRTGSFNMSDAGTLIGSTFTEPATVSTASYTMELAVTKQTGGGFTVDYYRDGNLTGSTTQGSGSTFATTEGNATITGIAFRHSQTPGIITYIDDVTVTVVPEPMSGILLLIGGALLVRNQKRRALA